MNDNGSINYRKLSRIVPLKFVGFVIINGILSNLQSCLTRPVLQTQLNTIEDIYNSSFPILTFTPFTKGWKSELTDILKNLTKHEDWGDKVLVLELSKYDEEIETYNRSISPFIQFGYANQILKVQKLLGIKGYHNSQTTIRNHFYSYDVFIKFFYRTFQ